MLDGAFDAATLGILEVVGEENDNVGKPPDAEPTEREQLHHSGARATSVKAVSAKYTGDEEE
ncbi:MAG: hypothetical protein NVS4B3_08020 [Gemmatimonadaceae bacterium]